MQNVSIGQGFKISLFGVNGITMTEKS